MDVDLQDVHANRAMAIAIPFLGWTASPETRRQWPAAMEPMPGNGCAVGSSKRRARNICGDRSPEMLMVVELLATAILLLGWSACREKVANGDRR